jgi:predicted NBD/HSP70 family sugar kinase
LIELSEKEKLVLHTIWNKKFGISQTDIKDSLKISKATISRAVNKLLDYKFVKEGELIPTNSKGRPQKLLLVNDKKILVSGIMIRSNHYNLVVGNLNGEIKYSEKTDIKSIDIIKSINNIPSHLKEKLGEKFENIMAFSIVTPGYVNKKDYTIRKSFFSKKQEISFKNFINDWPILFQIENDVNASLITKILFDSATFKSTFYIDKGFGASFIINNKLIRGEKGGEGEFGHFQVDPKGPKCWCGKNGCISAFFSEGYLKEYYKNILPKTYLNLEKNVFLDTLSDLYNERFTEIYVTMYEELLEKLANAITNVTDLLCIDNIILNTINPFFRGNSYKFLKDKITEYSSRNNKILPMIFTENEIKQIPLAVSLTSLIGEI